MTAVKDTDLGWNKIKRELLTADGGYTKVGLQEGAEHKDPESGEMSDLVKIGAINEFGTKRIPQRSFLRSSFDESQGKLKELKEKLVTAVILKKISSRQALGLLGEFFEARVKSKIRTLKTPPNALSTQQAKARRVNKGSVTEINNPLVDTGQMMQSIRHVEVIS